MNKVHFLPIMTADGQEMTTAKRFKLMHYIYVACMFYGIGEIMFTNSFMLLYLARLGVPDDRILLYLALPIFVSIFTLIPFAQWTERIGKISAGVIGLSLSTVAMVLLVGAGWVSTPFMEPLIFLAMCLYGIGYGMYVDSWFPMLSTIVPAECRGRFLGNNRLIYQTAVIAITFAITWLLAYHSSRLVFQCCLGFIVLLRIVGTVMYAALPDLDRHLPKTRMIDTLWAVIRTPGYLAFCAYIFLLSLFTGACPAILGLLAKDTLKMSPDQVMMIGNLTTIGALSGFFLAGRLVDRIGTKYVFMSCHFAFALLLFSFLLRDFVALPLLFFIGIPALLFGLVQAVSGVAISSEMLAVMPHDHKVMGTALNLALMYMGISMSGIFSSQMLKLGILSPVWKFGSAAMGPYDALLLICSVMIGLLVVTLGLIPSVLTTPRTGRVESKGVVRK